MTMQNQKLRIQDFHFIITILHFDIYILHF